MKKNKFDVDILAEKYKEPAHREMERERRRAAGEEVEES